MGRARTNVLGLVGRRCEDILSPLKLPRTRDGAATRHGRYSPAPPAEQQLSVGMTRTSATLRHCSG
jgi:hypothetical protein